MNNRLKLVAGIFLLVSCGTKLHAVVQERKLPSYYVTESFYGSSATCAGTSAGSSTISTSGTLLYGIAVTSPGAGSPNFSAYNSSWSSNLINTTAISTINTATVGFYPFNLFLSTGVSIVNNGVTPACITIIYQDRK